MFAVSTHSHPSPPFPSSYFKSYKSLSSGGDISSTHTGSGAGTFIIAQSSTFVSVAQPQCPSSARLFPSRAPGMLRRPHVTLPPWRQARLQRAGNAGRASRRPSLQARATSDSSGPAAPLRCSCLACAGLNEGPPALGPLGWRACVRASFSFFFSGVGSPTGNVVPGEVFSVQFRLHHQRYVWQVRAAVAAGSGAAVGARSASSRACWASSATRVRLFLIAPHSPELRGRFRVAPLAGAGG